MNSGLSIPLRIDGAACRTAKNAGERGIIIVLAGLTLIPRGRAHPIIFC